MYLQYQCTAFQKRSMAISAALVNVGVLPHLRGITPTGVLQHLKMLFGPSFTSELWCTVVPVMNGHPRDQAKVSVHCRWPLVTGTDVQAGDAKYNTPCNTT